MKNLSKKIFSPKEFALKKELAKDEEIRQIIIEEHPTSSSMQTVETFDLPVVIKQKSKIPPNKIVDLETLELTKKKTINKKKIIKTPEETIE
ncbi:MAG: hypothetical protein ACRC4M_05075 [Mycoplasma sp.]